MLFWILLAAAAAYALARVFRGHPRPPRPLGCLSRREAAFVSAAAEAMFPPGGAIPPSGLDADLAGYVDRFIAASHPRNRTMMRALFFLMEHATILLRAPGRGGMRRFSSLGFEQRVAVLDAWAESRHYARRLVFTSLRAILTLGYFAHPPVARQLGVAPFEIETPVCEADLLYPRVGALPETIPWDRTTAPSDGTPLKLDGPLHPDFAEGRS
jgi:hypothetical protein